MQCTADLLPADIVGANVFNQREGRFEFRPGPIFANIVLVDEINRASPKTQSGLLECMQERRSPSTCTRTSWPARSSSSPRRTRSSIEGTYPLPEAQVDRFMVRVSLGYPSAESEAAMLRRRTRPATASLDARAGGRRRRRAAPSRRRRAGARPTALRDYVVALLSATRADPRVELGASPRASLMLLRAAKARALLYGRDHALPDDVQALAQPVLAHRLLPAVDAGLGGDGDGAAGDVRSAVVASAIESTPAL